MALTFLQRGESPIPIDLAGLVPDVCRGWSLAQFNTHRVWQGNRQVELGELFKITGDPSSDEWHFAGGLKAVQSLGAGMVAGTIFVEGNIGRHAGAGMRGGELHIAGNASDWLGCELRGGLIRVAGSAGDWAGGAYVGSRVGMRGGTILIGQNAGQQAGEAMRRGTIAIGGNAGPRVGYRLRAGSIVVLGDVDRHAGAEMIRGTIAVLGTQPPQLLPTFRVACRMRLTALDLVLRAIARQGLAMADEYVGHEITLASGDHLHGGRGEVVWLAA